MKKNKMIPNILVIGDAILDCYIYSTLRNADKECEADIYTSEKRCFFLGGAANVCATIRSLGAEVSIASCIGNDGNGSIMVHLLNEKNICLDHLIVSNNYKTTTKTRLCDQDETQILRIDDESIDESGHIAQSICQSIEDTISKYDVIVLSDYNKGSLTEASVKKIIGLSEKYSKKVIVDPKSDSISKYNNSFLIKADYKQFCQYCSNIKYLTPDRINISYILNNSEQILHALNIDHLVITCADKGIIYLRKGFPCCYEEGLYKNNVCAIGSGDVVLAVISVGVAYAFDISEVLPLANTLAGNLVSFSGTSNVTSKYIKEIITRIKNKKVLDDLSVLIMLRAYYSNRRIVFTNGCFDWLHEGHVDLLEKSALLGDILIVAVNDDDSIKRLKGPERPVYCLPKRVSDLVKLSFVDYVIPFNTESELTRIIKLVSPNILVKGEEYLDKEITGKDYVTSIGGEVMFVQHSYDISTTKKLDFFNNTDNYE